jgi:hypothetical protein
MGRVITNGTTLSFAREASLGVLPGSPQWYELEPNGITKWGTTISKEARSPISQARARRKGVVTDMDSSVEIDADLTLAQLRLVAEDFLFSRAVGADAFLTSAATVTGYTVAALSAAAAGRLLYSGAGAGAVSLVHVTGFTNDANNGLKPITAVMATGATEIKAAGNVAEAPAATSMVEVCVAGVRGAAGDLKIDAQGNLISTALDFTTTGIAPGQVIRLGGLDVTHEFFNDANNGFARVRVVAAHKLTLDKKDEPFVLDDGTDTGAGGTNLRIDILFGQFVRNVGVNHADWREPGDQRGKREGGRTGRELRLSVRHCPPPRAGRRRVRPDDRLQVGHVHADQQRRWREGHRQAGAEVPERRQHRVRRPEHDPVHQPGSGRAHPVQPHHRPRLDSAERGRRRGLRPAHGHAGGRWTRVPGQPVSDHDWHVHGARGIWPRLHVRHLVLPGAAGAGLRLT